MAAEKMKTNELEISVEEKLRALFELQKVDSEIDKIRILRGELPLEVEDLEDEIAGLETRIGNYDDEVASLEVAINNKKGEIKNSQELVKKYKSSKIMFVTIVSLNHYQKKLNFRHLRLN